MAGSRAARVLALVVVSACGAEVRIGKDDGLKAVNGQVKVSTRGFTCGQPLEADGYVVTSVKVGDDCQLAFDKDVTFATAEDLKRLGQARNLAELLKAVELEVKQFAFVDTDTQATLDLSTTVKDISFAVDGEVLLTRQDLLELPKTVRIEGDALDGLRAAVRAQRAATAHVTASLVVPLTPPPPEHLALTYEVQPTLVLGPR